MFCHSICEWREKRHSGIAHSWWQTDGSTWPHWKLLCGNCKPIFIAISVKSFRLRSSLKLQDDKPIFIFYQSYLSANEPPVVLSRIPQRNAVVLCVAIVDTKKKNVGSGTLQKQMEMIKQKPSPVLFQHQVALAKVSQHFLKLCDYTMMCYIRVAIVWVYFGSWTALWRALWGILPTECRLGDSPQ